MYRGVTQWEYNYVFGPRVCESKCNCTQAWFCQVPQSWPDGCGYYCRFRLGRLFNAQTWPKINTTWHIPGTRRTRGSGNTYEMHQDCANGTGDNLRRDNICCCMNVKYQKQMHKEKGKKGMSALSVTYSSLLPWLLLPEVRSGSSDSTIASKIAIICTLYVICSTKLV